MAAADAGGDDTTAVGAPDAAPPPSATPGEVLGGPCVDDAQCDDGVECTFGACDLELGRCRFTADDARCADGLYCNGIERCHPFLGCRPGPPVSCSDSTPCTIDRCDETTRSCSHVGRDLDRDGDVDGNCSSGSDCDDLDPWVSSTGREVCFNARDDDCDGVVDESDCALVEFDTCADGLQLAAPGSYLLSPAGARMDYAAGCAPESPGGRDFALLVTVPPDRDVELVARSLAGSLSFVEAASCGEVPDAANCIRGTRLPSGPGGARVRLASAQPGVRSVYLLTDANTAIELEVHHVAPSGASGGRDCTAPLELLAGEPTEVDLAFPGNSIASACPTDRGDVFFQFTLTEAADVLVFAQGDGTFGEPRVSLRSPSCDAADGAAELACSRPLASPLHARALPAGTYYLAASADGPARFSLVLELRAPSAPPASDRCAGAPVLPLHQAVLQRFEDHLDDISAGCSPGRRDAARRLVLDVASDVLVIARLSELDSGSLALSGASCEEQALRQCVTSSGALTRVSQRSLPPGDYAVVLESQLGLPATLTAAARPARPVVLVPSADDCGTALSIGGDGGFFQGSTVNSSNDYSASCDFASTNGGPDQLLRLVLDAPRRVIFDMRGSDFETLLNVRQGPQCPGEELVGGCVVRGGGDRSFLDLDLPAGEYFVQIDGYAGASGSWFLDVYTLDPGSRTVSR